MSFEHGPLDTFEIIWNSGQIEYIEAHQVLMPPDGVFDAIFPGAERTARRNGWTFRGEVDGRWTLLLYAPAEDIRSVRNVTHTHDAAGGQS